jgi:hypothetical protein
VRPIFTAGARRHTCERVGERSISASPSPYAQAQRARRREIDQRLTLTLRALTTQLKRDQGGTQNPNIPTFEVV